MPDAIAKLAALFEAVRKYSEENEPIREKDLAEYRELSYRLMPRILDVLRAGVAWSEEGQSLESELTDGDRVLLDALDALLAQPTGSDGGV